jgi:LysR family transcriptional activator of mexEF-oprN operon
VCLYDPRHARVGKRLDRRTYFAHRHVIVSYNGDLRGVVEDALGVTRDVAISVPSFHGIGALVQGSALLATVPLRVAADILRRRPKLRTAPLPFPFQGSTLDLVWRTALEDDDALRFVMAHVARIADDVHRRLNAPARNM